MPLSGIYQPIRSELQATEALLRKELSRRDGLLGEMTRYVATMPGKRIRPALALLSAGLVQTSSPRKRGSRSSIEDFEDDFVLALGRGRGQAPARISRWSLPSTLGRSRGQAPIEGENDGMPGGSDPRIRLAVAVEMIHTATLLHDDVIDGASLRRGLSTLNAKWGDTLSVLSGDYLYSKAFCLLSELNHPAVLSLMSETTRIVCEGEVAQIQHQYNLKLSRAMYLKIIQRKTASLMGASAQAGALLGGASASQAAQMGEYGLNFGLAFQIMDDAQDLVGEEAALGKSLGTDFGQGQMTLPLIHLRDAGDSRIRNTIAHWFHGNGNGAYKEEQLSFLKRQALRYEVPEYCRKAAGRYLLKARRALDPFPPLVYKSSLLSLVDYLLK